MNHIRSMGAGVVLCMLLCVSALAQSAPDKAYLQKILDGWGSGSVEGQAQYYAQGPHVFYDVAPLKYDSWVVFLFGVLFVLGVFLFVKFHVTDDLQVHKATPTTYWGTATLDFEMKHKSGKVDMGKMRWTFVMEKQKDKWVFVHEHVSVPMT